MPIKTSVQATIGIDFDGTFAESKEIFGKGIVGDLQKNFMNFVSSLPLLDKLSAKMAGRITAKYLNAMKINNELVMFVEFAEKSGITPVIVTRNSNVAAIKEILEKKGLFMEVIRCNNPMKTCAPFVIVDDNPLTTLLREAAGLPSIWWGANMFIASFLERFGVPAAYNNKQLSEALESIRRRL
ncbi:MAG: hypothetical protein ACP5T3_03110 [Candidatus Micrarchaeia archaeon]